jgi:hypothetical protein
VLGPLVAATVVALLESYTEQVAPEEPAPSEPKPEAPPPIAAA